MGSKCCMDCIHLRTRKEYDKDANGYRVNVCNRYKIDLVWDEVLGIHTEANGCDEYEERGV